MSELRKKEIALSLFSFLLIMEWLLSLHTFYAGAEENIFILFVAMSFILYLYPFHSLAAFLVRGLYIFYWISHLYYKEVLFSTNNVKWFIFDTQDNISYMFHKEWGDLTNSFRTLLFFIVVWSLVFLIRKWLVEKRIILIFLVVVVIYIAILDTFTVYTGKWAIIRLVTIGLLMMGSIHFEKIKTNGASAKQLKPLILCMIALLLVSYIGPKFKPQWPDPIRFVTSHAKGEDGGSRVIKKVGYGVNDTNLGGPFIPDDKVVFNATDTQQHYWRVETKDVYTGKGWITSENTSTKMYRNRGEDDGHYFYNSINWFERTSTKKKMENAIVIFKEKPNYIVYPLGVTSISLIDRNVFSLEINTPQEKMSAYNIDGGSMTTLMYSFQYYFPEFTVDELRNMKYTPIKESLYLPTTVPKRVQDLSFNLVKNTTNVYDATKAIENYLHDNAFVYEMTEVAVPSKEQDYVDQFLFETKKGYCDNFSTSMVVMLRSVGIPARWVKGFTAGKMTESTPSEKIQMNEKNQIAKINEYEITNNNAHSWVEVYFPNSGWVTFEPTKGFSNPISFREEINPIKPESKPVVPIPEVNKKEHSQELELEDDTASSLTTFTKIKNRLTSISLWKWVLFIISVVFGSFLLFRSRRKWLTIIIIWWYKPRNGTTIFPKAYMLLLYYLDMYGLGRKEGQTLREYADYVDDWFEISAMSTLTRQYEQIMYNRHQSPKWKEVRKNWEVVMKRARQ